MEWFGAGFNGPLIVVRAVHFAATAIMAGTLVFRITMVASVSQLEGDACSEQTARRLLQAQTLSVSWIALVVTLLSGGIWLLLQAVSMSGLPFGEAVNSGVLITVLEETQFGLVSEIRAVLAIVLLVSLLGDRFRSSNWVSVVAALALIATIAWTGHAGSTPGELGNLHLCADALHLIAAGAWIGGLVPLALLLATVQRHHAVAWTSLAQVATQRFSVLGIASVATLLVSGIINASILVGSLHALLSSQYSRLLLLKLIVFAAMLAFAAINRFLLTPRLLISSDYALRLKALRQLTRNSTIEIALGLLIFAIVGLLGTMHPASHVM
jgi:putative copper resistance protein D